MIQRGILISFILILLGGGYVAHAQLGSTDPLSVLINPDYPRPYQIITVTPDSSLIDLSASTVTISVNGSVVQKGSGAQGVSVAVGGPGSITNITVTAVNNGQSYTKSLAVRPADVALIVEPNSTNHPFYEGGSLIGSEGRVRIIAVPDLRTKAGTQIPASTLEYTWKNGDQVLESSSGIGKSVLTATAPVRYRDTVITLTVSTPDQSVVAQAQTLVSPIDPIVRVYENDPLLGPRYENALPTSILLDSSEDTYRAVPYYFSSVPTLTWNVNGASSQTGQDITVRPTGDGKGTALLGITAQSSSPLQSAMTSLSVQFGKAASGIFGL